MIRGLLEQAVQTLGLEGVSTAVLLVLVSLVLYTHKASKAGGVVVSTGSTVAHDLKVVALVLAALLVAGVITADVQRGQELLRLAGQHVQPELWLEQVRRWVA